MIRKILLASLLCSISNLVFAYSVENPAYVDIQVLRSDINYKLFYLPNGFRAAGVKTSGINFHVALGYDITSFFGVELGALWSYRSTYQKVFPISTNSFEDLPEDHGVKNNVVYLVGKLGWPIWRFQLYAKGGISYVARQGFTVNNINIFSSRLIATPIFGVGTLFEITPHWSVDVSYFQALPQSRYQLPTAHFIAIGGMYRFKLI